MRIIGKSPYISFRSLALPIDRDFAQRCTYTTKNMRKYVFALWTTSGLPRNQKEKVSVSSIILIISLGSISGGNYSGCVSVARGMNGWPRSAFSMAKTTL